MQSLDILAALDGAPRRGNRACKIAQFLAAIPQDTSGLDALLAAIENAEEFTSARMRNVFSNLGLSVGVGLIRDHRAKRCTCFQG